MPWTDRRSSPGCRRCRDTWQSEGNDALAPHHSLAERCEVQFGEFIAHDLDTLGLDQGVEIGIEHGARCTLQNTVGGETTQVAVTDVTGLRPQEDLHYFGASVVPAHACHAAQNFLDHQQLRFGGRTFGLLHRTTKGPISEAAVTRRAVVLLPALPEIGQHLLTPAGLRIRIADHTADLLEFLLFTLLQGGVING